MGSSRLWWMATVALALLVACDDSSRDEEDATDAADVADTEAGEGDGSGGDAADPSGDVGDVAEGLPPGSACDDDAVCSAEGSTCVDGTCTECTSDYDCFLNGGTTSEACDDGVCVDCYGPCFGDGPCACTDDAG